MSATLQPAVPANTVPVPDVTALMPRVTQVSDLLQLRVSDEETAKRAGVGLDIITAIREEPKLVELDKACGAAHALHKYLTGLRGQVINPLDQVDKHLRRELGEFQARREREAKALQEKLQREAEEKAREEQARQEEERDPWEEEQTITAVQVSVPQIAPPALPISGLGVKKKPTTATLEGFEEKGVFCEGFKKLVQHIAAKIAAGDESALQYLQPNMTALTQTARQWGKKITEERLPGVVVIDDAKTVSRK